MPEKKKATTEERGSHDTDRKDAQKRGTQEWDPQDRETQERDPDGVRDQASRRQNPTKPAPGHNPAGTSHNPAQGSPSTRRNPEAGKDR